MTHPLTSDGDTYVSDTFSADEPRSAEPLGGAAESTPVSEGLPRASDDTAVPSTDFDIDFGQGEYHRSADDDLGIDLDFGAASPAEGSVAGEGEGIDLNFGEPEPEPEEDDDDEEESEAGTNALEAFRSELRAKLGDWYVVHTYSGMENRVLQNLENRVSSLNMEDYIYEIIVPTEEVTEIRNGQRKQVKRTRWALLKSFWNLSLFDSIRLSKLQRENKRLYRAYLLKEAFQQLWDYNSPFWAGKFLDEWCR